jgi:hypothetical protein
MLQAPLNLSCFEYRRHLKGGVTNPLLVAARDASGESVEVVLKVRKPESRAGHFGATSLACELICAILARSIELSVPDYAVVEVPRELISAIPYETARRVLANNVDLILAPFTYPAGLLGTRLWLHLVERSRMASTKS